MNNNKIKRRLVGNWDEQDKMYYFILQKWNFKTETYENISTFVAEKCEIREWHNKTKVDDKTGFIVTGRGV